MSTSKQIDSYKEYYGDILGITLIKLQQYQKALIIHPNPQSKFLARRSHASALLSSAKSEEEYLKSWNNSYKASKNDESFSSSSSGSIVSLADDNEDDCYGIPPPIQK